MRRAVTGVSWGALALGALALVGCGTPMTYPRTADVHRGVNGALRTNVSHSDARVKYSVRPGATPKPEGSSAMDLEHPFEGHAASSTSSYDTWVRFFGALWSVEGNLAYGFTDAVSLGGFMSTEMGGAELRLQALAERDGDPFSATFALGAAHVGIFQSLSQDLLREGFGGRAGVDLGVSTGGDQLLLGGYVSYIRRRRNFLEIPDDGEFHETPPVAYYGLMVVRDELKLSLPLGYAARSKQYAVIFGLVPEWTLHAPLRRATCQECGAIYQVDWFEQEFALYVTLGLDVWEEP